MCTYVHVQHWYTTVYMYVHHTYMYMRPTSCTMYVHCSTLYVHCTVFLIYACCPDIHELVRCTNFFFLPEDFVPTHALNPWPPLKRGGMCTCTCTCITNYSYLAMYQAQRNLCVYVFTAHMMQSAMDLLRVASQLIELLSDYMHKKKASILYFFTRRASAV